MWRYLNNAHASIHKARVEFPKLGRQDLPPYPKDQDALVALVERLRAPEHGVPRLWKASNEAAGSG